MNGQALWKSGEKTVFLTVACVVVLLALAQSIGLLLGDRCAAFAERALDDPNTEANDILNISEQNMDAYKTAQRTLKWAMTIAPMNSDYPQSLSVLYARMGLWDKHMRTIETRVPGVAVPDAPSFLNAIQLAIKAVKLDPANSGHLLTLGHMHAVAGDYDAAYEKLISAVESYPVNGAVRYAAAMQLLAMGWGQQAAEQARMLAAVDDTYRLDEHVTANMQARERRESWYRANLARSYLYKAMEIIWRTSGGNVQAVKAIVPENYDARETLRMFLEQKEVHVDD